MDKIVIQGGHRLKGEVTISGAKNAALPILCAAILPAAESRFTGVPQLQDVHTLGKLLALLGCSLHGKRTLRIDSSGLDHFDAPYALVKTMRASVLLLGPLLARHGRARVSLPGGCAIGARPIDQHLKGLEALGARIDLEHGYVKARARRLVGARIVFDVATVTGTENLLMAATLARGTTVLENAAREPEIEELANVLGKMGARISGAGTSVIEIEGVDELAPVTHRIMADRIEAGTFMVAAALTRGNLLVKGARPRHLDAVIAKLTEAGAKVTEEADGIRVQATGKPGPVDITTAPHPGFPTDMQAQFMVLASVASGQSVFHETIFENRYMHVQELARMGANLSIDGRTCVVRGVRRLQGADVMATDLRASASLVLAGLVAAGRTDVLRVYHLDRGYERIERKLRPLGATIRRARQSGFR